MKITILALALFVLFVGKADASYSRFNLVCAMTSPAMSGSYGGDACDGSNSSFPYVVPDGQVFCIQQLAMMNKFSRNPAWYGGDERSLYFVLYGPVFGWVFIPAHHAEYHFDPPLGPFAASTVIYAAVLNNMSEAQNMIALAGGYTSPVASGCDH